MFNLLRRGAPLFLRPLPSRPFSNRSAAQITTTTSSSASTYFHGLRPNLQVSLLSTLSSPLVRSQNVKYALPRLHAGMNPSSTRGVSTSLVGILARRLVLIPLVAFTGIGYAQKELKKMIPDFPDLGPLQNVFNNVFETGEDMWNSMLGSLPTKKERASPPPSPSPSPSSSTSAPVSANSTDKQPIEESTQVHASTSSEDEGNTSSIPSYSVVCEGETKKQFEEKIRELTQENEKLAELEARIATMKDELEKTKRENLGLRRAISLRSRIPDEEKRAIDLFSDILELRSRADNAFSAQDRLPRVVVVGDQSAGKTSVLEIIAQARIFPRGAGEMMTRSPIQVTLSEGTEHYAQIKGQDRMYQLDNETDLAALRKEIERRMVSKISGGETVSSEVVAVDVKGPGLRPMVLVDLPGIIQHHTKGMAANTKDKILAMCEENIKNPNSIILCIQDATRDAEGSSIADVVRLADPKGERTIFVLTKVDLAERLRLPLDKLEKTLKGERFDLKAKSYFAVVTGTENPDDSIQKIKESERLFFARSTFHKSGILKAKSMGTDQLSMAVSEAFWERVQETVESETRQVNMALRAKEAEWRNAFPDKPRLTRDELFNGAKQEILKSVSHFTSGLSAAQWEAVVQGEIWKGISDFVINELYLNSVAHSSDAFSFKARVDHKLGQWVGEKLPSLSVDVARNTLMREFAKSLSFDDADHTYAHLNEAVKDACDREFVWDIRSRDRIRHFQEAKLRDDLIKDAKEWEDAVKFMQARLEEEYHHAIAAESERMGPTTWQKYALWRSPSAENKMFAAAFAELSHLIPTKGLATPELSKEEISAVQVALKRKHKMDISVEDVVKAYAVVYRRHFLDVALKSTQYCQGAFGKLGSPDVKAPNNLQCQDVVLFWKMLTMLQATRNLLRLEAMEYKKELEESVRRVLKTISDDPQEKQRLLVGRRVDLAEDIEIIASIRAKLNAFVAALNKEKSSK